MTTDLDHTYTPLPQSVSQSARDLSAETTHCHVTCKLVPAAAHIEITSTPSSSSLGSRQPQAYTSAAVFERRLRNCRRQPSGEAEAAPVPVSSVRYDQGRGPTCALISRLTLVPRGSQRPIPIAHWSSSCDRLMGRAGVAEARHSGRGAPRPSSSCLLAEARSSSSGLREQTIAE